MSRDSDEGVRTRGARTGLAIYFAAVLLGSGVLEALLIGTHDPIGRHRGMVYLLMWTPAIASLIARGLRREGLRDVSFRLGGQMGRRMLVVAWLYPWAVGLLAYGIAWATGLATWAPPDHAVLGLRPASALARFALLGVGAASIGAFLGCLSAAGEEIGWRGYMLTRLFEARVSRPVLVSGVIWSVWHMPLILSGQYAAGPYPTLSAAIFLVDVVAFAYLAAWMRLRTGSVWPAVLVHASWNAVIQNVFDASTRGTNIWIGESGLLTAAVNVVLVVLIVRRPWSLLRRPGEALASDAAARPAPGAARARA